MKLILKHDEMCGAIGYWLNNYKLKQLANVITVFEAKPTELTEYNDFVIETENPTGEKEK